MRLYPVAPFLTRILPENTFLGKYEVNKQVRFITQALTFSKDCGFNILNTQHTRFRSCIRFHSLAIKLLMSRVYATLDLDHDRNFTVYYIHILVDFFSRLMHG